MLCLCFYKNGSQFCVLGFERWVLFVSFSFYFLKTLEEEVLFGYRFEMKVLDIWTNFFKVKGL